MLLPFLAFVFGSIVVGAAVLRFAPNRAGAIDRRLEELTAARDDSDTDQRRSETLISLMKRIGEKAPKTVKEQGARGANWPPDASRPYPRP